MGLAQTPPGLVARAETTAIPYRYTSTDHQGFNKLYLRASRLAYFGVLVRRDDQRFQVFRARGSVGHILAAKGGSGAEKKGAGD